MIAFSHYWMDLDFWIRPFYFVFDPEKRIFFVYLISSVFFAFFALLYQAFLRKPKRSSLIHAFKILFHGKLLIHIFKTLFHRKLWTHQSTAVDFSLFVFNVFFKSFIFFFITFNSVFAARLFLEVFYFFRPEHSPGNYDYKTVILIFTLSHFVLMDFSRFFQHYCFHKIPFLWRFHKVHHSAGVLTPLTLYRTHPVESLTSAIRRIFVTGFISGFFLFHCQSVIDVYSIIGVNALDFIFNFFASNLRHSHVWLSFGPLNSIFMSPAHHQIHHSRDRRHRDKNLGFALSVWDQFFGTFYQVTGKREFVIFGLRGEKHKNLIQALKAPFS